MNGGSRHPTMYPNLYLKPLVSRISITPAVLISAALKRLLWGIMLFFIVYFFSAVYPGTATQPFPRHAESEFCFQCFTSGGEKAS